MWKSPGTARRDSEASGCTRMIVEPLSVDTATEGARSKPLGCNRMVGDKASWMWTRVLAPDVDGCE